MFVFSLLPFSTSHTPQFNEEVYGFILYINQLTNIQPIVLQEISFVLNIEETQNIVLS